jgi:hypothetical protein
MGGDPGESPGRNRVIGVKHRESLEHVGENGSRREPGEDALGETAKVFDSK